MTRIRKALLQYSILSIAEVLIVFAAAGAIIVLGWKVVSPTPMARQAVVWVANVVMLFMIWGGLRLRGQSWRHFGLRFGPIGWRTAFRVVLQSIVVFVFALLAFLLASLPAANLAPAQGKADMSSYSWLQGNLPLFLLALVGVYIASSFGEEAIYRGFLINRIAEAGKGTSAAVGLAVAASSIVFGLIHFDWGIVGVIQTGFMGLALAVSYLLVRRNLWVLVLAHAYLDTLLLLQIYLGPATTATQ